MEQQESQKGSSEIMEEQLLYFKMLWNLFTMPNQMMACSAPVILDGFLDIPLLFMDLSLWEWDQSCLKESLWELLMQEFIGK